MNAAISVLIAVLAVILLGRETFTVLFYLLVAGSGLSSFHLGIRVLGHFFGNEGSFLVFILLLPIAGALCAAGAFIVLYGCVVQPIRVLLERMMKRAIPSPSTKAGAISAGIIGVIVGVVAWFT